MMEEPPSILKIKFVSSQVAPKKRLTPWRDKTIGPVLTNVLFRLAVSEGIHLKKTGIKQEKRWEDFTSLLFKQSEFKDMDGSTKSIQNQLKETKEERAKHHGWMDQNGGVTGNLSNHEGELSELDGNVKQILQDLEDVKAQKELKGIYYLMIVIF